MERFSLIPISSKERFDNAKKFWTHKVESGEIPDSNYFRETFYGENSQNLRNKVDDQDIYEIALNMLGVYFQEDSLPASTSAAASTTTGESTA